MSRFVSAIPVFPVFLSLAALAGAVGCVEAEPTEAEPTEAEPGHERSLRGVFERDVLWPNDDVVVCWDDTAMGVAESPEQATKLAEGRAYAEAAVLRTWAATTRLALVGWGPCTSTPDPDIIIGNSEGTSHSEFGRRSRGRAPSMELNLACVVPSSGGCIDIDLPGSAAPLGATGDPHRRCNGIFVPGAQAPPHRACVEALAAHEFGHALGLRHEQAHTQSTCQWAESLDYPADGLDGELLWGYDAGAVMNYCRADALDSSLSIGDIRAITTLYPSQAIGYPETHFGGGREVFGPGTYEVATMPWIARLRSLVVSAGLEVDVCRAGAGSGCVRYVSSVVDIPEIAGRPVNKLVVRPRVYVAAERGFLGLAQWMSEGKYLAMTGGLRGVHNDEISSVLVPPGLQARLCRHEGGDQRGLECSTFVGGPDQDVLDRYALPPGLDNNASFVEVSGLAVFYQEPSYRGESVTRGLGTYRARTSPWIFSSRSVVIPPTFKLKACTQEGLDLQGAGLCQTFVSSTNLRDFRWVQLSYVPPLPEVPGDPTR